MTGAGGPEPPPLPDGVAWVFDEINHVLSDAVDGNLERLAGRVCRIANEGGPNAMYVACYMWAHAAALMTGFKGMIDQGAASGVVIEPAAGAGPIDETAPTTWAARFFTAVCNDDRDQSRALFFASAQGADLQRHRADVVALLNLVGAVGKVQAQRVKDRQRRARRPGWTPPQRRGTPGAGR